MARTASLVLMSVSVFCEVNVGAGALRKGGCQLAVGDATGTATAGLGGAGSREQIPSRTLSS